MMSFVRWRQIFRKLSIKYCKRHYSINSIPLNFLHFFVPIDGPYWQLLMERLFPHFLLTVLFLKFLSYLQLYFYFTSTILSTNLISDSVHSYASDSIYHSFFHFKSASFYASCVPSLLQFFILFLLI